MAAAGVSEQQSHERARQVVSFFDGLQGIVGRSLEGEAVFPF